MNNSIGKVYPSLLSHGFADYLYKQGAKIKLVGDALDKMKWNLADAVNLEWRDGDYKGETKMRDFYAACAECLPVMIFGKSGETLRRWCNVREYYQEVENSSLLLSGSSFDHLLRAKRLEVNGKVPAAEFAVATAIKEQLTAEEMRYRYDPSSSGESEDRTIERLFSLSEAMWIPREAAELILQAVKIIREARKVTE